ncbi:peroxiredoxin [Mucilaginibacter polytrichastri]|uniref:thioredoxin-dependent peroxiredoxin n=1 Tax=Mucilaginibacter polytrichastri TaxID=1302689 RepID=A0A1Q5ZY73_9SPHI|nr:peroxiredoxin [Mucilaginibacter polytrichastri]OKS86697.1 hypothetical protein RG47T_2154 [Mucilaginibacter polytrichastri]SFS82310.1 peroxiredoxin Q/BCP [Mucilaginibacter polytrichastri]
MKTLKAGDKLPEISLQDQNGNVFNIRDYLGNKKLVVYFYPKDQSDVCTKEACAFRDSFEAFTDSGAIVVGINSGTVASHRKFAQKNNLPFLLLSDPGNKILKSFGIKPWLFLTGRETFVIGTDGKIEFSYRAFLNGDAHPEKVLEFLQK